MRDPTKRAIDMEKTAMDARRRMLQRIAEILGVSEDTFYSHASDSGDGAGLTIFVSSNGDTWKLIVDKDGLPLVRHEGNASSGGHVSHQRLHSFFASGVEAPERQALLRLIEHVLTAEIVRVAA